MSIALFLPFIITLLIGLLHYFQRKKLQNTSELRPIGDHLQEFARAWFLLAGLSLVSAFLLWKNGEANLVFEDKQRFTGGTIPYLFHILSLFVCAQTNLWLMRSILHLRLPYYHGTEKSSLPTLAEFYWAIMSSAIASYVLLTLFFFLDHQLVGWELCLSYVPQMLVSAGLFFWLGAVHAKLKYPILALVMWAYALAQLLFPITKFLYPSPDFTMALGIASIFVGAGTVLFTPREAPQLRKPIDGLSPIQIIAEHESDMIASRRFGQRVLLSYILMTAGTLLIALYMHVQSNLVRSVEMSCLLGVMFTIVLWLVVQSASYWILIHNSPEIKWEDHQDKLAIVLSKPQTTDHGVGWSREIVTRRESSPGGKTVVLLHGFGGSGRRSWGLLPALLLESGEASSVHLVSYRHDLYTRPATISNLSAEFSNMLEHIVDESGRGVVVVGHSLGGLIALAAFDRIREVYLHEATWSETKFARLQHLVCVASPIVGTRLAFLTFPFAWTCLRPMSTYILSLLAGLRRTFPSHYQDPGRRGYAPECTILCGSRDTVISPLVQSLGFAQVLQVPGWHATYTGEVFSSKSLQFAGYRNLLRQSPAIVGSLAKIIWDAGGRQDRNRGIVANVENGNIAEGRIEAVVGNWGNPVEKDNLLMDILRRSYSGEDTSWEHTKSKLERIFARVRTAQEMLRMDWGDQSTLVGWTSSNYLAIAILQEPVVKGLRGDFDRG